MKRFLLLFGLGGMLFFTLYWLFFGASSQPLSVDSASIHKDTHLAAVSPPALYGVPIDSMQVVRAMIQANESLGEILSRFNISASQIHKLGTLPRELFDARRLLANKPYTVIHGNDSLHTARSFIYHPNPIEYVALHFADSLEIVRGQHPVDTIMHSLTGTIQSSLYQAIVDAGGSPALANALGDVYAWEIDFFGLQGGDCFKVLYSTYEVAGQSAGFGRIQAANFTHMNKELLAFSYDQGEGIEYFDEVGNSLRKTFLKAPLQYSRISSHFSYSRLHPILKIRRPHLGVDYAAPRGTPVLSVGDGVIESVSYNRGAGKMVKIRHNSNFTTAYLHLSKYGSGIKSGVSVSQGQVIGYVGSTGLSTGPHLDFRFYKNGQPIDPLKVDPPSANPITEEHREAYSRQMVRLMDQLHSLNEREIQWAMMSEDRK